MTATFLDRAANHAADAVTFLQSVIRNPKAKYIEKLRAQEQLTELLGLAAAKKIEVSTTDKRQSVSRQINEIFGIVRRPTMPAARESSPINGTNGNGHHATEAVHNGNGATNGSNGHHAAADEPAEDKEAMEAME